jgi:parallel beta-helix repeat protein
MRTWLAWLGLLVAAPTTALDEFCVDSVAELNAAWLAADDDDVLIKLVQGTYNLTGSCLDESGYCAVDDHEITIRGGYTSTCQARSDLPSSTVLTLPGGAIRLGTIDDPLLGHLTLERFSIRNAGSVWFRIESAFSANYSLEMTRIWMDQAPLLVLDVDRAFIESNLFTRAGGGEAEALRLANVDRFTVRNNTFASNIRSGLRVANAEGLVANNIFFGNLGTWDLRVLGDDDFDSLDVIVRNNIYVFSRFEVRGIWQDVPSGGSQVDPQFVDAAALDFRLSGTSPAINSGIPNGPANAGADHDGGPRWTGEAPDRGAYESPIGSTATTLVVTSTNNSGPGTLRQAIIDANAAPNVNRIHFAIGSSCGPRVITLTTPLPDITGPVVIDGYTQPGATRNTLAVGSNANRCIVLDGGGAVISAIVVEAGSDAAVTIDGLAFGGFSISALNLFGGRGHVVRGSQFGGAVGALLLEGNVNALQIGDVTGAEIGLPPRRNEDVLVRHGARNVFVNSADVGIRVGAAAEATVIGDNYIGVGANGSGVSTANRDGVVVLGLATEIRGATISNNTRHGVRITGAAATGTEISDSAIGLPIVCVLDCSGFGNGSDGVRIEGGAARSRIVANSIGYNGGDGVVVTGSINNVITENAIFENGEQPIDLGDDGTSGNSNNSIPAPPGSGNNAQNRPVLSRATGTASAGTATGTLDSRNGQYRIDFYGGDVCGPVFPFPAASGEPRRWLGAGEVTISNGTSTSDGSVTFTLPIAPRPPGAYFTPARRIMATATRLNVLGPTLITELGTSEVSSCVTYDALLFADGFEATN